MIFSSSYKNILNHKEHKITLVTISDYLVFFFVEILDSNNVKLDFKWIVNKVIEKGKYKDCWMTISVSMPILNLENLLSTDYLDVFRIKMYNVYAAGDTELSEPKDQGPPKISGIKNR